MTTRLLDNLILTAVIDEDNKVDKGGGSKTIRNLAKFKSLKNFAKYKKLIKNLFKFKIIKRFSFLSSTTRLAYT